MTPNTLLDPAAAGVLSLSGATQYAESGIVSRTVLTTEAARVVLFGFGAGQSLSEHASPQRALVQILSGRASWTIGGETRLAVAGDLIHLPPGCPHAVSAIEPFSMLLTLLREPAPSSAANS